MAGNKNSGRKRKPTAIRKLEGNPGKTRLPENEPEFSDDVERPDFLSDVAMAEWERLEAQLRGNGLLNDGTAQMFAAYCMAWADMVEADANLQEQGPVIYRVDKQYKNPWATVKNEAFGRLHRMGAEFGLTPSASAKLGVVGGPAKKTEFERKREAKLKGAG